MGADSAQSACLRRSFVKRPALWRRLLKKERSTEAVAVKGNWLGIQQGQLCQLLLLQHTLSGLVSS